VEETSLKLEKHDKKELLVLREILNIKESLLEKMITKLILFARNS
jgi:hypothetical protein